MQECVHTTPQGVTQELQLNVMTVKLEKDWTSVDCLESLPCLKIAWQSYIWMYHKTSGTILFGQIKPRWRCLDKMYGTTFHLITVVKHGGGEVMSWAPHGHWPDLCIASVYNSRVKYEAIYLAANSWLKLGHAKAHAISSISEWLEKERTKVLQCISQSPALSLIEYLNVMSGT